MNCEQENNQVERSMYIDDNEHGEGRNDAAENPIALVLSQYTNEEPHYEQDHAVFVPHVHPSPPFYAESVDGYNPRKAILNQYRRSILHSNVETESLSEVLTYLNDMINKYFHMDCILTHVFMDEKMILYLLLKFSGKIPFEINSVQLMNFVGSNRELQLLPSLVSFIPYCQLVLSAC